MHLNRLLSGLFWLLLFAATPLAAQNLEYPKIAPDRLAFIRGMQKEAVAKKDSHMLAEVWYLYGKSYAGVGVYKVAQQYFIKSLQIQERYGDSYELGRIYLRMADMEVSQNHFAEALENVTQAKKIFLRVNSQKGIMSVYAVISRIQRLQWQQDPTRDVEKLDSLRRLYKDILFMASKQKDSLMMAEINLYLGIVETENNPQNAITLINRAYQYYSVRNKSGTATALVSVAPAYLKTGQFALALNAVTKANTFYNENKLNDLDLQMVILKNYVLYFQTIRDWENAFEYQKRFHQAENNKLKVDRNGALARLNIEFNTQQQQKMLEAQQKEITLRNTNLKTQQNLTWALSALLITAIVAGVVYFRLYRKNQMTSQWNAELLQEQNHRVKNNLQIITSLLNMQAKRLSDVAARNAVKETRLRVESMAILHRKLYDGEKFAEVELDGLVREVVFGVLKSYGFEDIKPSFKLNTVALRAEKAIRVGLILNELSTNACKYAFPYTEHPQFLITSEFLNDNLAITIQDNGPGIPILEKESKPLLSHSKKGTLGMSLIETLVTQLDGKSEFRAANRPENTGTQFWLEFKLNS
jgi:two-component sensor histidine kinase